jgi:hypothetical protein
MEPKGWSHTINSFLEPEDANADEDRDVRRFKGVCSLATNFCFLDSGLLAKEESLNLWVSVDSANRFHRLARPDSRHRVSQSRLARHMMR